MEIEDKGGQRLLRRVADPAYAERITEIRNAMREMDRAYAGRLASIRKAAQLTQEDMATRLGKRQSAVSKLERQHDLLLSTLARYIRAAGPEAELVVTVGGHELRYAIDEFVSSGADDPYPAVIGPVHDISGVARRLNLSEKAIEQYVARNELLACRTSEGMQVFPAFQFHDDGQLIPGLGTVLQIMVEGTEDRWQVALWLSTPSEDLRGRRPYEALKAGRVKAVEKLARQTAARWLH
ncbi:helix-turn-helix domain-containing protein [Mycolicibacterium phocaicum]|uniref:Uncharacterized protein n=1 Tax=Mycolicibacterium phocaicum TaxID=319706 RepID=A0A7I7ZR28_9MYCO|nr:helix-turn-helix transcriptional regulator [Mycolicibacterium phocaicum]TLH58420.1 hypothetical protein C1S79_27545 [Mycolicibacterium phocaicum]BBZ56696.1 hypothetical protein MPHO_36880 [Mycolicibacterium phocaicum]